MEIENEQPFKNINVNGLFKSYFMKGTLELHIGRTFEIELYKELYNRNVKEHWK